MVSCLIYLWIFLPHAAYWLDLGRVRTRPPFRDVYKRQDFDFTQYVVSQLVRKLTENTVLFDKFGRYTVRERVLRTVAVWHRAGKLPQLTKELLAMEAGAPLRSVNRAVAACAGEGIFCWEKRRFRVLDEGELNAFLPQ